MKNKSFIAALLLLCSLSSFADEGMWLLGNINKQLRTTMKEIGLEMPFDKVYSPKHKSLSDAVVSFGGFCSGVVVSNQGLVFTNHHCGFNSIQQHSSLEHDYIKDGFVAHQMSEELPNPELYVRFLIKTENVTKRMLKDITPDMSEEIREQILDSLSLQIAEEVSLKDSTLVGVVDAYYAGNEYWLSIYRDYNDVRLVFAPPSSIGKFGGESDNWMWPRHTGDFCVFRIYADKNNQPADYSPDNVPYQPSYVAPISLDGYKQGSFCMTMGYPASTDRYLSSYGIQEMVTNMNQAMIDMRGVKQNVWKKAMSNNDEIRIKYAAKYDESSNYWKNSIGKNKAIEQLDVIEKKRKQEDVLKHWIENNPQKSTGKSGFLDTLKTAYDSRSEGDRALSYYVEAFLNGPELIQFAITTLNLDFEGEEQQVEAALNKIINQYENYDVELDKETFVAMTEAYKMQVDSVYLPSFYATIDTLYNGNVQAFVDSLYAHTELTSMNAIKRYLEQDSTYQIIEDPAISIAIDVFMGYMDINSNLLDDYNQITRNERLLNASMRNMYAERNFYPDANFTMRLSFGTIQGYQPSEGEYFDYYTTPIGLIEKLNKHKDNSDYEVNSRLLELFDNGNYDIYADEKGDLRVCFISNNDITGGNSGSAMFNGKGELLGLAFDGNWEAMSSDIAYEPNLQRCIGVDVRYMLFVIEKYGKAANIIEELMVK